MVSRAVFLDRDGTLIEEIDYRDGSGHHSPRKLEDVHFLPGVIEGLKILSQTDYKIIIVTNQSGVSRGFYTEETLSEIHRYMKDFLKTHGIKINEIYYCPHRSTDGCKCRKPSPYYLELASRKFDLDLKKSWMVGDSETDIETGLRAGCKTILVGKKQTKVKPHFFASHLYEAVEFILREK
jgi:histidinol-phosphate phosphatase family protein